MFSPKLNLKCVFKYPFDGGKKLLLAECFGRNKIAIFGLLGTADSTSIRISPTKGSHFVTKRNKLKPRKQSLK